MMSTMTTDPFDAMLKMDPLAEAEKITGNSYKEDSATARLGFGMHLRHRQQVREELTLRGDTHYGSSWADTLRIFADLGFEVVHEHQFAGSYADRIETFIVLWREDGVLAKAETFGSTGRNTADVFYNWRPNDDVQSTWEYTSSGGLHGPSYDRGEKLWIGNHDVREAMRHKLSRLESNGRFVTPWVERPFLWLLDYSQSKVKDYDYRVITEQVITTLPEHIRTAINPEA